MMQKESQARTLFRAVECTVTQQLCNYSQFPSERNAHVSNSSLYTLQSQLSIFIFKVSIYRSIHSAHMYYSHIVYKALYWIQ